MLYSSEIAICHHDIYLIMIIQLLLLIAKEYSIFVQGLSSAEGDAGFRKYTLVSGLSVGNPYTSMAIIPPLIARSGLLEVRFLDVIK